MHQTAISIAQEMDGKFPDTYDGLLKLKGVGDYTASAIAAISFNLPEPVVDGNVYRVLARYFGVRIPMNTGHGKRYFKQLAREVMDPGQIADYNQGIMEFGAIQCSPRKPDCKHCPLCQSCVAVRDGLVTELPIKLDRGKVRKRYFNYLVLRDPENNTRIKKREGKGIWQNLFEFPLLESEKVLNRNEFMDRLPGILGSQQVQQVTLANTNKIVHKLSHQHLDTRFWIIETTDRLPDGISLVQLQNFPVPVLLAQFIKTL
jgi:A/G-specific adenine glycosylase